VITAGNVRAHIKAEYNDRGCAVICIGQAPLTGPGIQLDEFESSWMNSKQGQCLGQWQRCLALRITAASPSPASGTGSWGRWLDSGSYPGTAFGVCLLPEWEGLRRLNGVMWMG
jgi:hypothetical protein